MERSIKEASQKYSQKKSEDLEERIFSADRNLDYALKSAGWADDTPVWTGSCPCQSSVQAEAGRLR